MLSAPSNSLSSDTIVVVNGRVETPFVFLRVRPLRRLRPPNLEYTGRRRSLGFRALTHFPCSRTMRSITTINSEPHLLANDECQPFSSKSRPLDRCAKCKRIRRKNAEQRTDHFLRAHPSSATRIYKAWSWRERERFRRQPG